jgi:chromosome segregation ATPase
MFKNRIMKRIIPFRSGLNIVVFGIIVLSMFSCVSKKKFVAMELSRNQAQQRIAELNTMIENYESDYQEFNQAFRQNNSLKDAQLDSLQKQILLVKTNFETRSEDIEGQELSFKIEKQRLNQMLMAKNIEINKLNQQLEQANKQVAVYEKNLTNIEIKLRNAESELRASKSEVDINKTETDKLNSTLKAKNEEINKLKTQINAQSDELEKLNNQVKLLKTQFGAN